MASATAQAGAQIVRVGHPIQHREQRRFGEVFQHVVQGDKALVGVDQRGNALMAGVAAHAVQAGAVHAQDADAFALGFQDGVAHARPSWRPVAMYSSNRFFGF